MLRFPLLILLLFAPQDDTNARARELVEKLRSDSIAIRQAAQKSLLELGKAALPALRESAGDPDSQVAATATMLIRLLEHLENLSPRLRKWFPGIEDRLVKGGDHEATIVLLEAAQQRDKESHPLTRKDLDPLAGPALRGAASDDEYNKVCEAVCRLKLKGAETELRTRLKEESGRSRSAASTLNILGISLSPADLAPLLAGDYQSQWIGVHILEEIGGPEAMEAMRTLPARPESESAAVKAAVALHRWGDSKPLMGLLAGTDRTSREAIEAVGKNRIREAIPALVKLLEPDSDEERWQPTLLALASMKAVEAVPAAVRLLKHRDIHVREKAASLVLQAGTDKEAPHVKTLLDDPYIAIQLIGMKAAATWKVRSAIPALRTLAAHNHISLRLGAIEALGGLKAREAAPDLIAMLKLQDPSEEKKRAVPALAAMGAREAVPAIAGILIDDGSWSVGINAVASALRDLDARDQAPAIIERLKDPSPLVRWSILSVIGEFGWKEAGPEVAKLLQDDDSKVRTKAIWTLSRLRSVECAEAIESVLKEGGKDTEQPAFAALCTLDPIRAEPYMRRFLDHSNAQIRNDAVAALAESGDRQGLEALERLAEEPGPYWGWISDAAYRLTPDAKARVLRKLFRVPERLTSIRKDQLQYVDREILEGFAGQLQDPNPAVRSKAATWALVTGDVKLIPRVRVLLEDPSPVVRAAALSSLAFHKVPGIAAEVRERLFDVDYNVRLAAIGAVQFLDLKEAIPDLEEFMRSGDLSDWLQVRVIQVLGDLKAQRSVGLLRKALRDADPYNQGIRSAAVNALWQIGDTSATGEMARLLDDPVPAVRNAAIQMLAATGASDHLGDIERLLLDPLPDVRANALDAIARTRKKAAFDAIRPLLDDSDSWVRDIAAGNLLRLGFMEGVPRILHRADYSSWFPLSDLNAVRCPATWTRLAESKFTEDFHGTLKTVLETVLGRAKLTLDYSGVEGREWKKFSEGRVELKAVGGYSSILNWLQSRVNHPFEFILEPDSVRIATHEQARPLWKAWWADQVRMK